MECELHNVISINFCIFLMDYFSQIIFLPFVLLTFYLQFVTLTVSVISVTEKRTKETGESVMGLYCIRLLDSLIDD